MQYVCYREKTAAGLAYPPVDVPPKNVPYTAGTQTNVPEMALDRPVYHRDYHVHAALPQSPPLHPPLRP